MKHHIRFFQIILFILYTISVTAQSDYTPPSIPAKATKQLEEAVLQAKGGQPQPAITSMEELIQRYPTWTTPRKELSKILYASNRKKDAAVQLEQSIAIDTLSQLNELYSLGRIYEEISRPDAALKCYESIIRWNSADASLMSRATNSAGTLRSKQTLWSSAEVISFSPFDEDINTINHESLGRWTLDGTQMVFTRLLFDQEDIFFATFDTKAGLWQIDPFVHNTSHNEGAHAVSPDGQYLIFTSCNRNDGIGSCDLYLSFKQNGLWNVPTNMGPSFNSNSWDGQPCFGLDGLSLFFSSSRPGGMGGRDIWYVYQIAAGKWSNPINAGPGINTPDNEESPFVHFDGQTIYFMRDGKAGLGGYDLYMSRKNIQNKWDNAVNLGAPINTGGDEGALTLHPDGRHAIITRINGEQKNDLFAFEMPQAYRSSHLQALRATITDRQTGQPVRARLEIFETAQKDTLRYSQWTDPEGKISAVIRKGADYGVIVSAEDYMLYSGHVHADTTAVQQLHIELIPITKATEEIIVLENIFFETGSAQLMDVSETELNKLLWALRKNESINIEIRGHTDDVGDEKANLILSEHRAKAVYEYLVGRGIVTARLSYKGFGETIPIADNQTAEGRRKNRRTEFKVVR